MNHNDVLALGKQLMLQHGLTQKGWAFGLDNAVKRFGVCKHRSRIITISKPLSLLNNELDVKDVILHEIAHALVGRGHGHDIVWKAKCVEIGAKPDRCYDSEAVETPTLRYYAKCGACNKEYQRAKRPDPLQISSCRCQMGKPWKNRELLTFKDRHSE